MKLPFIRKSSDSAAGSPPVTDSAASDSVAIPDASTDPVPVRRRSFKKHKKKFIFGIIALIAIIGIGSLWLQAKAAAAPSIGENDTTILARSDFSSSISATGTVESAQCTSVYSSLVYAVKSVAVKAGDTVKKGQVLAKLDDQKVLDQIESQSTGIGVARANSEQAVKSAQDSYDQYKYALDNGLNSSLNAATAQVTAAYENYTKAVEARDRYQAALKRGENPSLLAQDSALNAADSAVDAATDARNEASTAYNKANSDWQAAKTTLASAQKAVDDLPETATADEREAAQTALTAARNAEQTAKTLADAAAGRLASARRSLASAESSYDNARAQLNATKTTADQTLTDYTTAVNSARQNYQDALTSQKATELAVQQQLAALENALTGAKVSANQANAQVSLRQLRVELKSTTITAPVDGTVTAVYATEGGSGSGLLFVIEDVHRLIVKTVVKEYDISTVKVGMPVTIKSDAIDSAVYDGVVSFIAPTSKKNALGQTDTSTDVVFNTEVEVTSPDTALRIGMSVRLNYISDQQKDVLTVPYEAVYTNDKEQSCVLVMDQQQGGMYRLRELPVTTGRENDLVIVINGDGVTEGLRVVNQPDKYKVLIGKDIPLAAPGKIGKPPQGKPADMQ